MVGFPSKIPTGVPKTFKNGSPTIISQFSSQLIFSYSSAFFSNDLGFSVLFFFGSFDLSTPALSQEKPDVRDAFSRTSTFASMLSIFSIIICAFLFIFSKIFLSIVLNLSSTFIIPSSKMSKRWMCIICSFSNSIFLERKNTISLFIPLFLNSSSNSFIFIFEISVSIPK
ncbi:unnamed protein product [Meloidogyne enterolobii]|uniref:Uncharacterized protein n=1 Tax=Meloidogyne enterolobii TaxID=390850 RepID=A0ACB0Z6J0_MELEN